LPLTNEELAELTGKHIRKHRMTMMIRVISEENTLTIRSKINEDVSYFGTSNVSVLIVFIICCG
jgi:hypothetical protein